MATRIVAMKIWVISTSKKLSPYPKASPAPRPRKAPMMPMMIVTMQPMGCIVGTRMRAMRPITMPARRALMTP